MEEFMQNAVVNPRSIVELGIVKDLESEKDQIQQVGVDIRVQKIFQIDSTREATIAKSSRVLPGYRELLPSKLLTSRKNDTPIVMEEAWLLSPGYYMWEAFESIKLPEDMMALIIHRSTLMKSGVKIVSAIWDPGYEGMLGCNLDVRFPIKLERGTRIAQVYFLKASAASKYNGVYLNKSIADFSGLQT